MDWQDLVCASCSGRVADGRCPTCRAAREQFSQRAGLPAAAVLLGALVLGVLLLLLQLAGHLS